MTPDRDMKFTTAGEYMEDVKNHQDNSVDKYVSPEEYRCTYTCMELQLDDSLYLQ